MMLVETVPEGGVPRNVVDAGIMLNMGGRDQLEAMQGTF